MSGRAQEIGSILMQEIFNFTVMFLLNPSGLITCGVLVYKIKNHIVALFLAIILTAAANEMILNISTYTNRTSEDFVVQLGFACIQCLFVYSFIRIKWKCDKLAEMRVCKKINENK